MTLLKRRAYQIKIAFSDSEKEGGERTPCDIGIPQTHIILNTRTLSHTHTHTNAAKESGMYDAQMRKTRLNKHSKTNAASLWFG